MRDVNAEKAAWFPAKEKPRTLLPMLRFLLGVLFGAQQAEPWRAILKGLAGRLNSGVFHRGMKTSSRGKPAAIFVLALAPRSPRGAFSRRGLRNQEVMTCHSEQYFS